MCFYEKLKSGNKIECSTNSAQLPLCYRIFQLSFGQFKVGHAELHISSGIQLGMWIENLLTCCLSSMCVVNSNLVCCAENFNVITTTGSMKIQHLVFYFVAITICFGVVCCVQKANDDRNITVQSLWSCCPSTWW